MKLLSTVFDDYLNTIEKTERKAIDIGSPSQLALTVDLPLYFNNTARQLGTALGRYKFRGSYGQIPLNMTDTPWVATFDSRVTTSAQRGFYIVLLFAKDMNSCVLSLNQGYRAFTDEFKKESLALKKIQQIAERGRANIAPISGATYGPIDLKADTSNSKGYELGAIASYVYQKNSLPSEEQFVRNYLDLLVAYDQLYSLAGKNLLSLQALTDSEFQAEVEKNLAIIDDKEGNLEEGPELKPELLSSIAVVKYKRDVSKSKNAIKRSGYVCEVDSSHISFISNVTKKMYLEAHHLVPMSAQEKFRNSLDVIPNIISLCPNCHRLIHHGTYIEKIKVIKILYSKRRSDLIKKGVDLSEADLLYIYKGGIEETD